MSDSDDLDDEIFDVLSAMSAQLVTEKPFYESKGDNYNQYEHSLIVPKKVEKPSSDVFYRDTALYTNKLPQAILSKKCFCKYACENANATISCFSCAIYEVNNQAYYCDDCFKARHPWYRVQHYYESIDNDEDITYNLKLSKQSANFKRVEYESKQIHNTLQAQYPKLVSIQDHKVDDKLRHVGRNLVKNETKIVELKDNYENEVETLRKQYHIKIAIKIQSFYRGHLARRTVSLIYTERTLCVWDLKHKACKFFKFNNTISLIFF